MPSRRADNDVHGATANLDERRLRPNGHGLTETVSLSAGLVAALMAGVGASGRPAGESADGRGGAFDDEDGKSGGGSHGVPATSKGADLVESRCGHPGDRISTGTRSLSGFIERAAWWGRSQLR